MESNIAFRLVTYGDTYEELQIEDDDNSLVENGEQQELDINDIEWFRLIWNLIVLINNASLNSTYELVELDLGQLAQLYG